MRKSYRLYLALIISLLGIGLIIPAVAQAEDYAQLGKMLYQMGEEGDPSAVPYLQKKLNHENAHIRRVAAHALGKIGRPEAATGLLAMAKDARQPVMVRCECVKSLARLGGSLACQKLQPLGSHPDRRLRQAVQTALQQQAGKKG